MGIYTARLVEALVSVAPEDSVFLFAHQPIEGLPKGLPVRVITSPASNQHTFLQFKLPKLLIKYGIDILHGPNFYLPLFGKTPSVVTVHDLSAQLFPEQHTFRHRLSQKFLGPSLKKAKKIIAVSNATSSDIFRFFPRYRSKVVVVYNGVHPIFKPATPEEEDEIFIRYNLPDNFLLYVGTLEPRKNVHRLVGAFARASDRLPETKLVIAGPEGWLYDEVFVRIRELNIVDEVIFIGYVPFEDLPALYSAARVFCYPSLYEGFGLPPLEAAACGTPVVSSDRSSIPEIMRDAALLVNPMDIEALAYAIVKAFSDENLRQELINKGYERAANFKWEECARKTLAIYKELL